MNVPSPCIDVCRIKEGICVGCHRTNDEIRNWRKMSNEEKQAVLDRLKTKIYLIQWYNEDNYGIMGCTSLIVQAKNEEQAWEVANNEIIQDLGEEEAKAYLAQYKKKQITNISDKAVLSYRMDVI